MFLEADFFRLSCSGEYQEGFTPIFFPFKLNNCVIYFKEFLLRGFISQRKVIYTKKDGEYSGKIQYFDDNFDKHWNFVSFIYLKSDHLNLICKHFGYRYGYIEYTEIDKNFKDYIEKNFYINAVGELAVTVIVVYCYENATSIKDCLFKKKISATDNFK